MPFSLDFKKLLPHGIAIAIFYAIILAYFTPMTQGYQLKQGDISKFKGMVKEIQDHREIYEEEALWTNSLFSGMPAFQVSTIYPSNLLKHVNIVFQGFMVGGIGALFLCFLMFYFLLNTLKVNPYLAIAGAIAFGLTSHFIVLLEAGHNSKLHAIGYLPAVLAGILMVFRGNWKWGLVITTIFASLEIYAAHVQITYYFSFFVLFLIIGFLVQAVREKTLPQFGRSIGLLCIAGILGITSNASILYNSYQYSKATMRGGSELTKLASGEENIARTDGLDTDYITMWSLGVDETWAFLLPNAKGGATKSVELRKGVPINSYFGNQPFTSGPVYLGAFVCLLYLLSLAILKGPLKWAALAAIVFYTFISWGSNFMSFTQFMVDVVPMYTKFRAPTMALMGVNLLAPLMGILALDKLLREPELLEDKKLRMTLAGISGGLVLILLVFASSPGTFVDLFSTEEIRQFDEIVAKGQASEAQILRHQEDIETFRSDMVSGDAWRALFLVVVAGGLSFLFIRRKQEVALAVVVGLVLTIDLWSVDKDYVNNEKQRGKYENWEKKRNYFYAELPDQADQSVLNAEARSNPQLAALIQAASDDARKGLSKDERQWEKYAVTNEQFKALEQNTNFRVFNLGNSFQDSRTSFFHKSVGGYSAVKMGRYQDLIDFHLGRDRAAIINSLQAGGQDLMQVLEQRKILNMLNTRYIKYNPQAEVITNPHANGNAWFVQGVAKASNPDEEMEQLGAVDPKTTAVVAAEFLPAVEGRSFKADGSIEMTSIRSNEITYHSSNSGEGLAVFSEIYYYPGWNLYVDGAIQDHIRVNYLLRGAVLPAGEHDLVFRFEPKSYQLGNAVGYASSALIYLMFFGMLGMAFRKNQEDENK